MTDAIVVATIAAAPGLVGAVLNHLNHRALRKQTDTGQGVPMGRLLDQLDRKIDKLSDNVVDVRERVARLEGEAAAFRPAAPPHAQAARR